MSGECGYSLARPTPGEFCQSHTESFAPAKLGERCLTLISIANSLYISRNRLKDSAFYFNTTMHGNGDQWAGNCIVTDRGGIVETTHYIHAAIVDSTGKLLYSIGNPDRLTLLRSAAKPAQALAILETGALQKFGFDEYDLALICASHSSEERHLARARNMMNRIQASEDDLQCGGHPSITPAIANDWVRNDINPTAIYNNCSGKHAGMLAGAQAIGASMVNYHHLNHPMQQRVKQVVEDLCNADEAEIKWAIDGCNLPSPAVTLLNIARMYANFAEAADVASTAASSMTKRTHNMARIFNAMSGHPELVAGEGRFCTALMEAFQGDVVGKVGADGCYGVAIRQSDQIKRLGAQGSVGISAKVEDGDRELLYSAVVEILAQLEVGTSEKIRKLASFHHPNRTNTMGVVVGGVSHRFQIRPRKDYRENVSSC